MPPRTARVPRSGGSIPARILRSVDLPEPLGPTRPTWSPSRRPNDSCVEERAGPVGLADRLAAQEQRPGHPRRDCSSRGIHGAPLYGACSADAARPAGARGTLQPTNRTGQPAGPRSARRAAAAPAPVGGSTAPSGPRPWLKSKKRCGVVWDAAGHRALLMATVTGVGPRSASRPPGLSVGFRASSPDLPPPLPDPPAPRIVRARRRRRGRRRDAGRTLNRSRCSNLRPS